MTAYSFKPKLGANTVNWSDATIWTGGIVPNAPDADVDFPTVTQTSTGSVYTSFVNILEGKSFSVRSVDLRDYLIVRGSLTVSGQLTQEAPGEIDMLGGTITAGSIVNNAYDIQGDGHLVVGTLTNNSLIIGGNLTVDVATLVNNGTLEAGAGTTTINVGTGGLSGFSGGVLRSGTLQALKDGTLALNAGGAITVDAAAITLSGGIITSRDVAAGGDVPLTTSLREIASGGLLTIEAGGYHFGTLSVSGTLAVAADRPGNFGSDAVLTVDALTVTSGGHLSGTGVVQSALVNDGIIQAGTLYQSPGSLGTLVLQGDISGSGHLEILPGVVTFRFHDTETHAGPALEVVGALQQNVVFDDPYGTLRLDRPENFTGTITVATGADRDDPGDVITLPNVDFSTITGTSYVGAATGGTLTLQQANGAILLKFSGSHALGNFSIAAVPGALSSDPTSVKITVSGHGLLPVVDFNGDGHSDILWQNVNGAVSTWHATGTGSSDGIVQDTYDAHVDPSWTAIDNLDYNGDGRADILWQNRNGTVAVWAGTDTGFAQSSYVGSFGLIDGAIVGTGDFNGDGRDDVLYRNADSSIGVQGSNGTSLVPGILLGYSHGPVGANWLVEGAADFTGDGKADILWRNRDGSRSTWDANGTLQSGTSFQENSWFHGSIDLAWHVVGLGDFDGDSKADLLWRNDNGALSVWTSTGDHGFAENQFNAYAASNWFVAETGDLNADGKDDIIWRNTDGQISIWHSSGADWVQNTYLGSSVGNDWSIAAHHFVL